MKMDEMLDEMRDVNLNYLMLAQSMIQHDKVTAIFRLGIAPDIADLIEAMSNAQILKLAGGNMMLARFRFDDGAILSMLTNYTKDRVLAQSHAAILMAARQSKKLPESLRAESCTTTGSGDMSKKSVVTECAKPSWRSN